MTAATVHDRYSAEFFPNPVCWWSVMADCAKHFAVIEETLGEALALHQSGQLAAAEKRYREILAVCGDQAEVLYYLGLLCQADGRLDEALRHLEAARQRDPQQADAHLAVGALHQRLGAYVEAVDACREAVNLAPEHGPAWYNLGAASFAAGQLHEAIAAYERAVACTPDDVDSFYNLAIAYDRAGQPDDAIRAYDRAMELAPTDPDIPYNLALLYKRAHSFALAQRYLEQTIAIAADYAPAYTHLAAIYGRLGRSDEAIRCYERLLELGHDEEAARHMLAALRGERLEVVAAGYVRKLFDGYAGSFEQELVAKLGYTAPRRLRQLVGSLLPVGNRLDRVLDLGCGTGLAGEVFRDLATTLIGVDLSPRMVALAEQKRIYDALKVGEIVEFCCQQTERCDCIVAADVLVYLGEIAPFFAAVAKILVPGGLFAFSTERCEEGFVLRPTGRHAHATDYVAEVAAACGLRVVLQEETRLRREKEAWLIGDLFVLAAGV